MAGSYSLKDALRSPGLVSLLRLPLAAIFPWTVGTPWALVVLVASAVTDMVDGWLARRLHERTTTGAALDGLMDKAFLVTVVITLMVTGALSVPLGFLTFTRDLAMLPLVIRVIFMGRAAKPKQEASAAGKATTVLQFATLAWVSVGMREATALVLITTLVGLIAAIGYWVRELSAESPSE